MSSFRKKKARLSPEWKQPALFSAADRAKSLMKPFVLDFFFPSVVFGLTGTLKTQPPCFVRQVQKLRRNYLHRDEEEQVAP